MATIQQLPSGNWRALFYIENPDGTRTSIIPDCTDTVESGKIGRGIFWLCRAFDRRKGTRWLSRT